MRGGSREQDAEAGTRVTGMGAFPLFPWGQE